MFFFQMGTSYLSVWKLSPYHKICIERRKTSILQTLTCKMYVVINILQNYVEIQEKTEDILDYYEIQEKT